MNNVWGNLFIQLIQKISSEQEIFFRVILICMQEKRAEIDDTVDVTREQTTYDN